MHKVDEMYYNIKKLCSIVKYNIVQFMIRGNLGEVKPLMIFVESVQQS